MPIVDMPIDLLVRHIAAGGGPRLGPEELPALMGRIGVEVEETADTRQYGCGTCGKVFDRTEAQGAPVQCGHCGTDFRDDARALREMGSSRVLRLNMLAVRPDIFDAGGMARYVRGFLGVQRGLLAYRIAPPTLGVRVDPGLSNEHSLRPWIACAVLRNVRLDHEQIKQLMNLQEDLHWAVGRDRKLASIGVYDLDVLRGPEFRYDAVPPDGVRFVPLGFPPEQPASRLTPAEILEKHATGRAYAHLLAGMRAFPLLRDAAGTVLSMPPIINSEATRVTMRSRNLFIDVTGLSQRTVDRALNIMVTSLQELLPEAQIESVRIAGPSGVRTTPDLSPTRTRLSVREAAETIGARLDGARLTELLERMGHGVERDGGAGDVDEAGQTLTVLSPAWRPDVMHPVDLIEDAAIALGYEHLEAALVPTFTVGRPLEIEEESAIARRALAGLGFHQVMTLGLTSPAAAFVRLRLPPDDRAVLIENPISSEQTMCRVSLLPGLLETLAINKQHDLPQSVFEVGDCCFVDDTAETGAREERFVAAAMIGTHVGYADVRAVADAFVHEMGAVCGVEPIEHASLIPGRAAALTAPDGSRVGLLGELHPEVIENYGLRHAVAVFELRLGALVASRPRNGPAAQRGAVS